MSARRGRRGTNRGRGPTHCAACGQPTSIDPCSDECRHLAAELDYTKETR